MLPRGYLYASISGVLLVLAFPKPDLWPVAWVALVPLFMSIEQKRPTEAFRYGYVFGVVLFFGTQYWISHSIRYYGGGGPLMSYSVVLLLCMYEAIYTGVFCLIASKAIRNSAIVATLVIPAVWTALEYLRGVLLTGFPWSFIGYTQTECVHLIQLSDITGVYGLSWLVVLVNLLVYGIAVKRQGTLKWALALVLVGLCFGYSYVRFTTLSNTPEKDVLKVALIQPNVDQSHKWDKTFKDRIIKKYFRLTSLALKQRPDLIIWPETALIFYYGSEKQYTERLNRFIKSNGFYLLTGAPLIRNIIKNKDGIYQYITSNSAILLGPDGNLRGLYDKIHLVPFGEYVPLRKILFFVQRLVEGIGDFKRGDTYSVFEIKRKRFFVVICYEAIFPGLVRTFPEADFMVNITNDAWFGNTSGPYQHTEMARLRAVERRISLVRVANTGISEVVDPLGRVLYRSNLNTETTKVIQLKGLIASSLYQRYGDIFSYIMILITVAYTIKLTMVGRKI